MTPEMDKEYRRSLHEALEVGKNILTHGGTALEAVEKSIRVMEDNPLFNAGRGAVFTHEGKNELDAAIMDGSNLAAGAVAGVSDIKNPITAARFVMTNKKYFRIGDTPVIGAGTYANNQTCAISATGHGEFFIRWTVAHDISALLEYKGLSLKDAAELVVNNKLVKAGGSGGVIGVDKLGNVSLPFNSEGMFRGFATSDGKEGVFIYKDESYPE